MKIWAAALADLAAIGIFAGVGRASHSEPLTAAGVLQTAWPFLVGWALGVLASRAWRRPEALRVGAVLWVCTVSGGMALRLLTGDTAQLPFVVVASITLAVLLLGWRGLAALIRARGSRRAKSKGQTAPRHDPVRPAP
jgi:peptidoglycan/LPS O-acetylase OafA/YrhL